MGRRAKPQKGIYYTFKFYKGGKKSEVTLLFEGFNRKGRLEFYNYKSKAFTSMTPERFGYIHRFNLVKEEPVPVERYQIQEVPTKLILEETKIDVAEAERQILKTYHSLTQVQVNLVESAIGRPASSFVADLDLFFSSEEEAQRLLSQGLMSELMRAQDALRLKIPNTAKII